MFTLSTSSQPASKQAGQKVDCQYIVQKVHNKFSETPLAPGRAPVARSQSRFAADAKMKLESPPQDSCDIHWPLLMNKEEQDVYECDYDMDIDKNDD